MKLQNLLLAGLAVAVGMQALPGVASAQGLQGGKPITIVVPFPPGGTSDLMGRIMAKGMSKRLGVPVVVDNKGGGGTLIGSQHVARAEPDGHTLLLAATPHAINASLYKNIPYNTRKDFRTVAYMAEMPLMLAVPADSEYKTVQQLVDDIKSGKKELTYGSSGIGGSPHLATELFLKPIGGKAAHVPYRGSNPAVMDLAAGRTTFAFDTLYLIMTQVEAGKLRPLAHTGTQRHPRVPDVPTLSESGFPDYNVTSWFSIAAPGATPDAVVETLNQAINDTLKDPEVVDFLTKQGMMITGGSAKDAQARLLKEIDTWEQAVKISGASMD